MAALDKDKEIFVVHVASLVDCSKMSIHPSWGAQIASLITNKTHVTVPIIYSDFANMFSPEFIVELLEYIEINNHPIELIDGHQPPYGLIYSLKLVELETLKIYIKTNLANNFI